MNRLLRWAAWSRFQRVRDIAWSRVAPAASVFEPVPGAIRVLFGGDVVFDPDMRRMWNLGLYRLRVPDHGQSLGARVKRRLRLESARRVLSSRFHSAVAERAFDEMALQPPEDSAWIVEDDPYFTSELAYKRPDGPCGYRFPFAGVAPLFRQHDLVVVNLETPLSDHPRCYGIFRSDPAYAKGMREAGVSLATVSNNHVFDAGEIGFVDTLRHLECAGLGYIGGGATLGAARRGRLAEVRGTKLLFLGYTQYCNSRFASLAGDHPGLLPLDRRLIVADIRNGRTRADVVIVSLHWGMEDQPRVHPAQTELAHALVDAGADAIIGHHPHVPHAVEIYRRKPIVYSLGNFVFPRWQRGWTDNYLAEIVLDGSRVQGVVVHPITGTHMGLFQPRPLTGAPARELLRELQLKSLPFNTGIAIHDDTGHIRID